MKTRKNNPAAFDHENRCAYERNREDCNCTKGDIDITMSTNHIDNAIHAIEMLLTTEVCRGRQGWPELLAETIAGLKAMGTTPINQQMVSLLKLSSLTLEGWTNLCGNKASTMPVIKQINAAVEEAEGARCRLVWKEGLLEDPRDPRPSGRCTKPAGHELIPGDNGHLVEGHQRPIKASKEDAKAVKYKDKAHRYSADKVSETGLEQVCWNCGCIKGTFMSQKPCVDPGPRMVPVEESIARP